MKAFSAFFFFSLITLNLTVFAESSTDEKLWDFGGMYGFGYIRAANRVLSYPNPATGEPKCPTGYTDKVIYGTADVDWPLHICFRRHVSGEVDAIRFGGVFGRKRGGESFVNTATNEASCPEGYSRAKVLGSPGIDSDLYLCYASPSTTRASILEFGGMFGSTVINGMNSIHINPITQAALCGGGFQPSEVLGTTNLDHKLKLCSRKSVPEKLYDFGGMYGLGFNYLTGKPIIYANPATGSTSCPFDYDPKPVYGTKSVDWTVYICARRHVPGQQGELDFGGMYAEKFPNPATGSASCPNNYVPAQILGTKDPRNPAGYFDYPMFFCYKRADPSSRSFYEFAGAFGWSAEPVPLTTIKNPLTQTPLCPNDFNSATVAGVTGVDYEMTFCYR